MNYGRPKNLPQMAAHNLRNVFDLVVVFPFLILVYFGITAKERLTR